MKFSKSLFLAFAGLGLFACSNEEVVENNQLPEGVGAVTINIQSPAMSRAIEGGTSETTVTVKGGITITLDADTGDGTINLSAEQLGKQSSVTFWNVKNPRSVTVTMNGGKASYASDAPTVFSGDPAAVPAYGYTENNFTLTGNTASPGDKGGTDYETGNKPDDANKTYQLYTATVQLAIPVARLEVSGIQHVIAGEHEVGVEEGKCAYKKLTIAGVYLDNVYATGSGVTYAGGAFPCATGAPTDYSYGGTNGTGTAAILKDAATVTDFLTVNQTWPEDAGKAYAYYFYGADGADNLPKFKIYFSDSESQDATSPLPAPRYAMITSYKQTSENGGGQITKFEPGHIYRITSAKLTDENIIGDEGGNTLYGVEVTVVEAEWTVETIDADWAK